MIDDGRMEILSEDITPELIVPGNTYTYARVDRGTIPTNRREYYLLPKSKPKE